MTDNAFIDRLLLLIDECAGGNKSRFAELIDASSSNINDWINRGSFPRHEHLANLKEKLNVNINWFLTGIGPRYLTNNDRVKESEAEYQPRAYTDEEREVLKKVLEILRQKKTPLAKNALYNGIKMARMMMGVEPVEGAEEVRVKKAG